MKKIIQHVKKFGKKESDRKMSIVIAGDFNAHHEVWNCYNTDRSGEVLLAETEEEGLFVINYDTMSRLGSPSQRDSNIDLLFANDSVMEKISYKQGYDTWGSDHYPIIFEIKARRNTYKKKSNRLSTKKTKWLEYQAFLDSEDNKVDAGDYLRLNIKEKYSYIIDKMKKAVRFATLGRKKKKTGEIGIRQKTVIEGSKIKVIKIRSLGRRMSRYNREKKNQIIRV